MINKNILEINLALKENKITYKELFDQYNNNLKKIIDSKTNAIITNLMEFNENIYDKNSDSLLNGIVCSVKDNISTKKILTTAGSKTLENYKPIFDATVIKLLKDANCFIGSKSNLDEFGMGGDGLSSFNNRVKNIDNDLIVGGSSSGSIICVKEKACAFAIATDTGDSIRRPCSLNELIGFKPSYGLISRFGVMSYSSSLDHVGIIARHLEDVCVVLDNIVKYDKNDNTSVNKQFEFLKNLKNKNENIKIGILENLDSLWDNKLALNKFNQTIEFLKKQKNISIIKFNIEIELLNLISGIYKTISYTEALTSWNNLSGIGFGLKDYKDYKNYEDLLFSLRNKLGSRVKKRFIIGTYSSSPENFENTYLKSKQIINIFKNKFNEIFKDIDVVLIPGASDTTKPVKEYKTNVVDDLLQIANFIHSPSITIKGFKINNLPIGINLFSKQFSDDKLLNIAYTINELLKGIKYE